MLLREIEVFRLVMSSGSASKAAALLDITQPAVSQSLQRLEAVAGFALFNRLRGRLHPTPEARALLVEVERAFVGLSSIEHRMRSLKQFGVNTLRVSSYPAFGLGFLPRALARLMAQRRMIFQDKKSLDLPPLVSMQISSSQEVRERVVSGQADFGLMADEMSIAGLESSVFARFAGVVVMPPEHRLSALKLIKPQHLANEPFIALNPEDASRRRLEAALTNRKVQLNIVVETPYAASVCECAASGLGIGIVNPITALDYARQGLTVRPLSLEITFACLLVMTPGQQLSGVAQDFLKAMRIQLAEDTNALVQRMASTN